MKSEPSKIAMPSGAQRLISLVVLVIVTLRYTVALTVARVSVTFVVLSRMSWSLIDESGTSNVYCIYCRLGRGIRIMGHIEEIGGSTGSMSSIIIQSTGKALTLTIEHGMQLIVKQTIIQHVES
jgi:hypothetical protein